MGMVESSGGLGPGPGWPDCHRGHGSEVVLPLAGHRARDGVRRRADVESAGVGAHLEMGRKRQVMSIVVRVIEWSIVAASFAWVIWWV